MLAILNRVVICEHEIWETGIGGECLERTVKDEPNVFLFGRQNVDPAYEQLIRGASSGETRERTVTYLPADSEANFEWPRSKFSDATGERPRQGMVAEFRIEAERDLVFATVTYVDDEVVKFTTNEPFAGMTVRLKITVLSVRAAHSHEIVAGWPDPDID